MLQNESIADDVDHMCVLTIHDHTAPCVFRVFAGNRCHSVTYGTATMPRRESTSASSPLANHRPRLDNFI